LLRINSRCPPAGTVIVDPEMVVFISDLDGKMAPVLPLTAVPTMVPFESTAATMTFIVPDVVFDAQRSTTQEPL
jgi:hypothetical protein